MADELEHLPRLAELHQEEPTDSSDRHQPTHQIHILLPITLQNIILY